MKIFLIIINWLKSIFIKPKIRVEKTNQSKKSIINFHESITPRKRLTYPTIYRETGKIEKKLPDIAMGFIYKPKNKI